MKYPWLPINFTLPDNNKCRALLYQDELWQIYQLEDKSKALIVTKELLDKWINSGVINTDYFIEFEFNSEIYFSLYSEKRYSLFPISENIAPETKADILSFASSLKESRLIDPNSSFEDSIYVEKFSRLLPLLPSTLDSHYDDKVIGKWMTGGVKVPITSFRRITCLVPWLNNSDITDIVNRAGLSNNQILKDKNDYVTTADQKTKVFELPGRQHLEEFFNEHIVDIIVNADRYKSLGINFPAATILHGKPGCGKTFAVERLADFLNWPIFSIDANSVASPYIHDTSKKIAEVFNKAMESSPSIVVIDEMESFLSDRESSSGQHHVEEVAEFLRRIPEALESNVLILGMTNRIEMIDPAILRRGRFDHIIELGMPSETETESLINSLLSDLPVSEDIQFDELINRLSNRPLSDTAFIIRESARLAAKFEKNMIDQESISRALDSLPQTEQKSEKNTIGFIRGND